MANPKYVRLKEGIDFLSDVKGRSGFSISGNNVREFPGDDNRRAQQFVKEKLQAGILEEASKAEFDEVATDVAPVEVKMETTVQVPHQEAQLRGEAAATRAKQDASRAKAKEKASSSGTTEPAAGGTS